MRESPVFDWNLDYLSGHTPWETGHPSHELVRALELGLIAPGRAFEMGCGSGRNAVYLAGHGFSVTAADCSSIALARARLLAADAKANVRFLEADVCHFTEEIEPVDFMFDRSCYEYLRHTERNREGYLKTLRHITHVGSRFLLIVRRSRKKRSEGIDVGQILMEFGGLFRLDDVASAKLQSAQEDSVRWAFLMIRQAET